MARTKHPSIKCTGGSQTRPFSAREHNAGITTTQARPKAAPPAGTCTGTPPTPANLLVPFDEVDVPLLCDLPHDCLLDVMSALAAPQADWSSLQWDQACQAAAGMAALSRFWKTTVGLWAQRNCGRRNCKRRRAVRMLNRAFLPAAKAEYAGLTATMHSGEAVTEAWFDCAIDRGNARLDATITALCSLMGFRPAAVLEAAGWAWDAAVFSPARRGVAPLDFFELHLRIRKGAIRAALPGDDAPPVCAETGAVAEGALQLELPSEFLGVVQMDGPFAALPEVLRAQMRKAGLVQRRADEVPDFRPSAEGRLVFREEVGTGRLALHEEAGDGQPAQPVLRPDGTLQYAEELREEELERPRALPHEGQAEEVEAGVEEDEDDDDDDDDDDDAVVSPPPRQPPPPSPAERPSRIPSPWPRPAGTPPRPALVGSGSRARQSLIPIPKRWTAEKPPGQTRKYKSAKFGVVLTTRTSASI